MNYNHFNPKTKLYTHSSPAAHDPIEGKPMPTTTALFVEPPALADFETAKVNAANDGWDIVADYRGYRYWTPESGTGEITEAKIIPPSNAAVLNDGDELIDDGGHWRLKTVADFLQEAKEQAKLSINGFASDIRVMVTDNADAAKLAGWVSKIPLAERMIAGTASVEDSAIIQLECDKRGEGETPLELANKQHIKALALAQTIAIIDGMESAAIVALNDPSNDTINKVDTLLTELKTQAETELTALLAE